MRKLMKAAMLAAGLTGGAAGLGVGAAQAGPDPFLGEIMMVGFNFCPRNWINADGQLLPISNYSALFSLYGTTFGGDGRTTFAVPDLRGRFAMHAGHGAGLPDRRMGQRAGSDTITLRTEQLAPHTHAATATGSGTGTPYGVPTPGSSPTPLDNVPALSPNATIYAPPGAAKVAMGADSVDVTVDVSVTNGTTGSGAPIDVTNPFLVMRYCVAVQGVFPSRP